MMNFNEENIAIFDAYLRGEMKGNERQEFEQRLANEAYLKQEFEAFKAFEQAIEFAEVKAFKTQLENWDSASESKSTKGKIIPMWIYSAAAIALIGFLAFNFFFSPNSTESLVADYFQPYDNVITIRGEQAEIDKGLHFYDLKDYEQAIGILAKHPDNQNAQFYLAESHLALSHYQEAAIQYESLLNKDATIFKEIIQLHLALSYIGLEKTDKAKSLLHQIKGDYSEKAQALLDELR